jgi:hypothetical protein
VVGVPVSVGISVDGISVEVEDCSEDGRDSNMEEEIEDSTEGGAVSVANVCSST